VAVPTLEAFGLRDRMTLGAQTGRKFPANKEISSESASFRLDNCKTHKAFNQLPSRGRAKQGFP
jgi:hypothetical protein